jgi:lipid II:glycine glycyltransferase (peptidoglycan interpeptide bridge formation enzyme)
MSICFATEHQIQRWNELVNADPDGGNLLQGKEFMEQKAEEGWTIRYLMVDELAVAMMEKYVFPLGKVWYAPKGPSTTSVSDLDALLAELVPFARKTGVFSLKIEPELDHTTNMLPLVDTYGLERTNPIQYNFSTVYVDLSPSLDDIMKSLPQKGRHAIRRAERDGVTVEQVEPTDENCQIMYQLLRGTADDSAFAIRPPGYYQRFYRRYAGNGGLFFASYQGEVVAGAFAMVQGGKSMYKDGASIRQRTAYGASHLLQWRVIEWAKAKGSRLHDLAGAPPVAKVHDQTHPFYNIGRFKRQFNKQVTEYVGTYNIPVARLRGVFWTRFWEKVIRRLYFKFRGQAWY